MVGRAFRTQAAPARMPVGRPGNSPYTRHAHTKGGASVEAKGTPVNSSRPLNARRSTTTANARVHDQRNAEPPESRWAPTATVAPPGRSRAVGQVRPQPARHPRRGGHHAGYMRTRRGA